MPAVFTPAPLRNHFCGGVPSPPQTVNRPDKNQKSRVDVFEWVQTPIATPNLCFDSSLASFGAGSELNILPSERRRVGGAQRRYYFLFQPQLHGRVGVWPKE
ncbi:hypothetical protein OUZ56_002043 [Daphnia magna]|uniref:Uncharacterized protein n=1 Tax=Daphnia magna TaxID=35525 RepID=A0ABR0A4I4_9CRUS|nr:hypothetical protein OUZ56_002043 [Daphnia magna]